MIDSGREGVHGIRIVPEREVAKMLIVADNIDSESGDKQGINLFYVLYIINNLFLQMMHQR